ncbi:electron transport complex subunit RsxC [Spirochaeta dissipatitropha]
MSKSLFPFGHTFRRGGIHPRENKFSENESIVAAPIPELVYVPISQHIGAPAELVVEKGESVLVGQLLASPKGFVSAPVHSPVSGKIVKIDEIVTLSGYPQTVIQIKTDGDVWQESIDRTDLLISKIELTKDEIVKKIAENGIVGLGGAAFPTSVKYSLPPGKVVDTLIINGVECEPYLTADYRLMLEHPREIVVGIRILMRALGVRRACVGIEKNTPDASRVLREVVADCGEIPEGSIEFFELQTKYPQGAEKQLINAILKREVPSGKLPLDVGAVVNNVGTAFAVYQAVQKRMPLLQRVVTVTGSGVTRPGNYLTRIGTPISGLISFAGGLPKNAGKVIAGGPMMGKAVDNLDAPVVKGTSGVLILSQKESRRPPVRPCIRCSRCVAVCPMGLEPYLLETLSRLEEAAEMDKRCILDCMECGSCAFTCPAGRPLLDHIRVGKQQVMKRRRKS